MYLQLNEIAIPRIYRSYRLTHEFPHRIIDTLDSVIVDTDEYDARVWPVRKS
jgi:hypothetical protein